MLAAHVVPSKGAGVDWVVRQLVRDVERMGHHGKVTLRSDQEPALVDLLRHVARARGDVETVIEHSPRDSKANGMIERGVRTVEEVIRVQQLEVERQIGTKMNVHSAAYAWLVECAVDCWNKIQVGSDGRTAYERLKHKRYRGEYVSFGAPVMFRIVGKVKGGEMCERWAPGTWLGKRFHSSEDIVAQERNGLIVRTNAVKPLPEKLTAAMLDDIRGTPWAPGGDICDQPFEIPAARVRYLPPEPDVPDAAPDIGPIPRGMRITQDIIDRVGYSAKCAKCRAWSRGDYSKSNLGHSQECWQRVESMIAQDEVVRKKYEESEARKNQFYAQEIERAAKRQCVSHPEAACPSPSTSPGFSVILVYHWACDYWCSCHSFAARRCEHGP